MKDGPIWDLDHMKVSLGQTVKSEEGTLQVKADESERASQRSKAGEGGGNCHIHFKCVMTYQNTGLFQLLLTLILRL